MIVATRKEQVLVPVGQRTIAAALHGNFLHHSIAVALKFAHVIAVDYINFATLRWLQREVGIRTRHVRQEQRTTGSQVLVGVTHVLLIVWSEVITDYE